VTLNAPGRPLGKAIAIGWIAVCFAAGLHALRYALLGMDALYTLRFADKLFGWFNGDGAHFFARFATAQRPKYLAQSELVYAHILLMAVALMVGCLQFVPRIRERWPPFHRAIGYAYASTSTVGGVCGAYMAFGLPMDGDFVAVLSNVVAGSLLFFLT
jgi:hypothetical protein